MATNELLAGAAAVLSGVTGFAAALLTARREARSAESELEERLWKRAREEIDRCEREIALLRAEVARLTGEVAQRDAVIRIQAQEIEQLKREVRRLQQQTGCS